MARAASHHVAVQAELVHNAIGGDLHDHDIIGPAIRAPQIAVVFREHRPVRIDLAGGRARTAVLAEDSQGAGLLGVVLGLAPDIAAKSLRLNLYRSACPGPPALM